MRKLFLFTIFCFGLLLQSRDSFSFEWPVIDSNNRNHHIVIQKFIANAKNEGENFKYIGHLFKVRGGNNQYISKNTELYRNADILKNAFLSGKRIQIKPTSSYDVYSEFTEKCLYKILINGSVFIEGLRVYNADDDILQPQQANRNNNVLENNNNNIAIQQSSRVNQNVNIANLQDSFNFRERGYSAADTTRINRIIQEFKNLGELSIEAKITKIIKPQTYFAREIIFMKDNQSSKIIKTFKDKYGFQAEKQSLKNDSDLINNLNTLAKNNNAEIPKIIVASAALDTNNLWSVIQEEAKGEAVKLYNIPNMNDVDIIQMFKSIGKQFGNLDHLLKNKNKPLIIHPDSHGGNLMYDDTTLKLYWIDTSTIANDDNNHYNSWSSLFFTKYFSFLADPLDRDPRFHPSTIEITKTNYRNLTQEKINGLEQRMARGEDNVLKDIKRMLSTNNKFALAIKSLGEGYIAVYPEVKSLYNDEMTTLQIYKDLQEANILRAIIGKPDEPVFDLLIR
ncbi:MAG: hypothetical protein Q8K60_00215 [Parachlamydiaceae bacterium]|nr:hypothetical protein [Parachlamydiaceae bacterium]